jgi:hypothetical protein
MKNIKVFVVSLILVTALFITSCDVPDRNSFDSKLIGTWVTNGSTLYSGTLTIDYYTIKIDGYDEGLLSVWGNDSNRPFRDYPKGIPLTGYSEEGKIFIEYKGLTGIPYDYYETTAYPKEKILEFTFGDRKEMLQKKSDY